MKIEVHVHNDYNSSTVMDMLREQRAMLLQILGKEATIMADLTALTEQVAENTSVEASAVLLLQDISARLTAAGTDPAALAELAAQLDSSANALAAAIVANTPAAPEEPPIEPFSAAKRR